MTQVVRTLFTKVSHKIRLHLRAPARKRDSNVSPGSGSWRARVRCCAISPRRIVMFRNLKIKTKMLAAILFLGIIAFAGLLYIVSEFRRADETYGAFLDNEAVAATQGTRSSTSVLASVLQASMMLDFDPDSDSFKAVAGAKSRFAEARDRLKQAESQVPSQKAEMDNILAGIDELEALTNKVIDQRRSGDVKGASAGMAAVSDKLTALVAKMQANNNELTDRMNNGADALSAHITTTIDYTLGILGALTLLAIALGVYVAQTGIATPLTRLHRRMATLASGDTTSEIEGLDRRDEIGQMAFAVSVFRDNAIERARLEAQAEADRNLSDRERAGHEAQRAADAAHLQQAVQALGDGLKRLADGDLVTHINTQFVAHLDLLRQDFNNSLIKLNEAMQAVGANARAIGAGASEMRGSADELSKRTEHRPPPSKKRPPPWSRSPPRSRTLPSEQKKRASLSPIPAPAPNGPARSSAMPSAPCSRSRNPPPRSATSSA